MGNASSPPDEPTAFTNDQAGNASLRQHPAGAPSGSLGAIVGNFKSVTSRRINRMRHTPGARIWQRNYYEHIIRNQRELDAIRCYIADNPQQWHLDHENPSSIS